MGLGDDILRTVDQDGWYVSSRTRDRWYFDPGFRVRPGRLSVETDSRAYGHVLIEPHVKHQHNKDWGIGKWQELVERSGYPLLQCDYGKPLLTKGVSTDFEGALSLLAGSLGIVTTDGALHHAAGALGKPAVVIWGCFTSPENLGYPFHMNLYEPDPEGLGQRRPHPACRAAMDRITVDAVLEAMERAFGDPEGGQ